MSATALLLSALLLMVAASAHGAAPTAGTTQQQLAAGQPPTLTNFRADNGAVISWDKDVTLTWTQQGQPTQWRVSANQAFLSSPWMALPATQPYKWILGVNPTEGTHIIYMQLRNDHGESAVATTTIEYRAAPKISSAKITAASSGSTSGARLELFYSGKLTRWAVSKSAQPPAAGAAWNTLTTAVSTPSTFLFDMEQAQMAEDRVTGRTVAAWVHVQRDASPIDSKSVSFVYNGPQRFWSFDEPWETSGFVERLGARNRISAQRLSSAGVCAIQHLKQMAGPYAQGVQGLYAAAGKDPMTTPVVCRFNVFGGKALAPGWTLKIAVADDKCRVISTTTGATPSFVVEVTLPVDPMPTVFPKAIGCNLDIVQLDGPWSIGEIGLGAIP